MNNRSASPLIAVAAVLLCMLQESSVLGSEDEEHLRVDWLSECGCTGIEIESVTLTSILWHRGYAGLRLNQCSADNPRCAGQPPQTASALVGLTSARAKASLSDMDPDVAISHVAFMGICGIPNEFSDYVDCELKQLTPAPGFLSRMLGGGDRADLRHGNSKGCTRPYMIARAMGEEDSIGEAAASQCNHFYDEVWVPSTFHVKAFEESGVKKSKIHIVPETIDFGTFDPARVEPEDAFNAFDDASPVEFTFLSVFKWEARKNWTQLLLAFVHLFLLEPRAGLFIKTSRYMGAQPRMEARIFFKSLVAKIKVHPEKFIQTQVNVCGKDEQEVRSALEQDWVFDKTHSSNIMHRLVISAERLPTEDMPGVFKAGDAFVLPSHGEGWGLPLMEAMAMELPTIGTKFGGNVDFMHSSCSLLVDVDYMTDGGGGAQWAVPDIHQLMGHMHWVFANQDAAKELGKRARKYLLENWGEEVAGSTMQARLAAAKQALLQAGTKGISAE